MTETSISAHDAGMFCGLSPDLHCILDAHGVFTWVGPNWEHVLGPGLIEAEGASLFDLVDEVDAGALAEAIARVGEEGKPKAIVRHRRAGREDLWVEWHFAVSDEGRTYASGRDVTERRRAADATDALRTLEDEAEQVAELGSWRFDLQTLALTGSPQAYRLFGLEPDQSVDLKAVAQAALHPDDRKLVFDSMQAASTGRKVKPVQCRILHPDGRTRWLDVRSRPAFDASGTAVALTGFAQDVTDRVEVDLAAADREARLEAVIDNAPFGAHMYTLKPDGRLVFVGYNAKAEQVLPIDHEALIGLTLEEAFPGDVGTETPERYREVARTGVPWENDDYAYDSHGISGVFETHAFAFGPGRVSVFFREITEQKRAEAALRVSEEHFRAMFEQAAVGMAQVSSEGTWLQANDRLCELLGYSRPELLGLSFVDITHPDDREASMGRRDRMAAGLGDSYSAEKRYLRKDGSIVWVHLSDRAVRDESGNPRYFFTVFQDISERKQAEAALRESNAHLEQMVYDVAEAMGRVIEVRDPYTRGHQERVASLSKAIAIEMGLPVDQVAGVELAALVHDIGKLSVPAEILCMPRELSSLEFSLIQEHPAKGYEILKDIEFPWPVAQIVLQHHERMDGSGYPGGLTDEVLVAARVLGVADVVEAMASHRPYRAALGLEAAAAELRARPDLYDPDVVAAVLRLYESGRLDL